MWTKEKAGDLEVVSVDEDAKQMLKTLIAQNGEILSVNIRVIDSLINPLLIVKNKD